MIRQMIFGMILQSSKSNRHTCILIVNVWVGVIVYWTKPEDEIKNTDIKPIIPFWLNIKRIRGLLKKTQAKILVIK